MHVGVKTWSSLKVQLSMKVGKGHLSCPHVHVLSSQWAHSSCHHKFHQHSTSVAVSDGDTQCTLVLVTCAQVHSHIVMHGVRLRCTVSGEIKLKPLNLLVICHWLTTPNSSVRRDKNSIDSFLTRYPFHARTSVHGYTLLYVVDDNLPLHVC